MAMRDGTVRRIAAPRSRATRVYAGLLDFTRHAWAAASPSSVERST